MVKSVLVSETSKVTRNHDFGVVDRRGRRVGVRITTSEVKFKEDPSARMWYPLEPGHYYSLNVWATRNGTPFGRIQSTRYFHTAEERSAALKRYMTGAQKRSSSK